MTAIDRLAARLAGLDCRDPAARTTALAAFLDTVACMIAARDEDVVRRLRGLALSDAPGHTALFLGAAAHALDFDDHEPVGITHPSAVLVPAILALGASRGCSGRAAVDAYLLGYEAIDRIGAALNPRHYELGWHATSTIGALAAAAACGTLLRLDEAGLVRCLSLAASMAAGTRQQFGTAAKPLHAGLAARAGIEAALFAEAGLAGSAAALDGRFGLAPLMTDRVAGEAFVPEDDARLALALRGPIVKRFPSCAATHRTLDQLLELRTAHGLRLEDIRRIETRLPAFAASAVPFARPETPDEARFSMPFCAAALLSDGALRLDHFAPARLRGEGAHALADRVTIVPEPPSADGPPYLVRTRVELRSGDVLERQSAEPVGAPQAPLTAEAREAKFRDCVAPATSPEGARALAASVLALDAGAGPATALSSILDLMRRAECGPAERAKRHG